MLRLEFVLVAMWKHQDGTKPVRFSLNRQLSSGSGLAVSRYTCARVLMRGRSCFSVSCMLAAIISQLPTGPHALVPPIRTEGRPCIYYRCAAAKGIRQISPDGLSTPRLSKALRPVLPGNSFPHDRIGESVPFRNGATNSEHQEKLSVTDFETDTPSLRTPSWSVLAVHS